MKERLAQLGLVVLFLGAWEAVVRVGIVSPALLAPPSEVAPTLVRLLGDPDVQAGLAATALEVVAATAIGAPLGVLIGLLVAETLGPDSPATAVLYFGTAIPKSIFLPLFALALGVSQTQKVAFGVFQAFFIIAVTTIAAAQAVPPGLLTLARGLRARRSQVYRYIYLPAMLPVVVQGVRLGVVFAVTGVLLAEMYVSRVGIGRLINVWGSADQLPQLLSGVVLTAGGTILLNELLRAWERRLSRWRA